jgi:hypothetical protein
MHNTIEYARSMMFPRGSPCGRQQSPSANDPYSGPENNLSSVGDYSRVYIPAHNRYSEDRPSEFPQGPKFFLGTTGHNGKLGVCMLSVKMHHSVPSPCS